MLLECGVLTFRCTTFGSNLMVKQSEHQEAHHAAGENRQPRKRTKLISETAAASTPNSLKGVGGGSMLQGTSGSRRGVYQKSCVNLFEARGRNTFAEKFLATFVADEINYGAAQC